MNNNPNTETSSSQRGKILAYLQGGGSLTGLDAWRMFGCYKFSARLSELRARGHKFLGIWEEVNGVRFKRYTYVQPTIPTQQ